MITYNTIILISWATFLLVWGVNAFNVKRDIKGGGFFGLMLRFWLMRLVGAAVIIFVVFRIITGKSHYSNFTPLVFHSLFMLPVTLGWIAALLSVLGVAFAIWARVHLGRNWSSSPAIKEKHELVTSGPYAFVRHPIYTGVILMAIGSALTGIIFGIVVLPVVFVVFIRRIDKEEKIMLELFPIEYAAYQKRTKRLVPFVW